MIIDISKYLFMYKMVLYRRGERRIEICTAKFVFSLSASSPVVVWIRWDVRDEY